MKTLTMIFLMLATVNAFAFSKKIEAEFNNSGSTICSDRSIGKGNTEDAPAEEEPSEATVIEN